MPLCFPRQTNTITTTPSTSTMGHVTVLEITVCTDLYNKYSPQGQDIVLEQAREFAKSNDTQLNRIRGAHPNASKDWVKWKVDSIVWPLYSK